MSEVADQELLHRRIHWTHVKPDGSLCSAAFTDPEMSVDRAALRRADETLRDHVGHGLAALTAGFARSLDQEVREAPELLNKAHALVVGKKTKGTQKKFAKAATWVVRAQKPALPPSRQESRMIDSSDRPGLGLTTTQKKETMAKKVLMTCVACGQEVPVNPITKSLPYTDQNTGGLRIEIFRFCLKHGCELPTDPQKLRDYLINLMVSKTPNLSVTLERDHMVDMVKLYEIVKRIAVSRDVITYEDLSQAYKVETGGDVHRRQWGVWLGLLSGRCTDAGFPPISTVVVSATDSMPGDGYWGIPGSPPYKDYNAWKAVCDQVHKADWPPALP